MTDFTARGVKCGLFMCSHSKVKLELVQNAMNATVRRTQHHNLRQGPSYKYTIFSAVNNSKDLKLLKDAEQL